MNTNKYFVMGVRNISLRWTQNHCLGAKRNTGVNTTDHLCSLGFCEATPAGWPTTEALQILNQQQSSPSLTIISLSLCCTHHCTPLSKLPCLVEPIKPVWTSVNQASQPVWLNFWGKDVNHREGVSDCQCRPWFMSELAKQLRKLLFNNTFINRYHIPIVPVTKQHIIADVM